MNPDKPDWKTMTPRERDALVATEVMKWKLAPTNIPFWDEPEDKHRLVDNWTPTANTRQGIADAFEVVEKMRQDGFECDMLTEKTWWSCQFYKVDLSTFDQRTFSTSESLTDAICKSALRACGVEVGK